MANLDGDPPLPAALALLQVGTILMTSTVGFLSGEFSVTPAMLAIFGTIFCVVAGFSYWGVSKISGAPNSLLN